jgi:hypothetical protein
MDMKFFKGPCEIGLTREDVKHMLFEYVRSEFCKSLNFPAYLKLVDIKISPDAKYAVRLTFENGVNKKIQETSS